VISDLKDLEGLIEFDKIYLACTAEEGHDIDRLLMDLKNNMNIAIVVSGQDLGFTRQEKAWGEVLKISLLPENTPPTAIAAIVLYEISKSMQV